MEARGMNDNLAGSIMEVEKEFWRLAERFRDKSDELHDSREREPYLLDILSLAKGNLDRQSALELCFLQVLEDKSWPLEILEFCMHELHWSAVKKSTEEAMAYSTDIRELDALERVLKAFEPDWEDADLYRYYSQSAISSDSGSE